MTCVWFKITRLFFLHRSGENSRPFTISFFKEEDDEEEEEEGAKGERHDLSGESVNLDTSDYHSATSSDCGSTASSDTEEEAKDDEKEVAKKEAAESDTYTILMVPRIRKRRGEGPNKVKYVRNMVIISYLGPSVRDILFILSRNPIKNKPRKLNLRHVLSVQSKSDMTVYNLCHRI